MNSHPFSRRILISGASVAGNTVAWWLGHAGFDVTVVERTPAFRDGGQKRGIVTRIPMIERPYA